MFFKLVSATMSVTLRWPEKAVLYCWCRRPAECCAHPPQLVYCERRSCPGSALTSTVSAAWWETGCQQISSGSTSKKGAEWNQNTTSVMTGVMIVLQLDGERLRNISRASISKQKFSLDMIMSIINPITIFTLVTWITHTKQCTEKKEVELLILNLNQRHNTCFQL